LQSRLKFRHRRTDGEAAPALIEYGTHPIPSCVLLGTSLTYRLKDQFFLPFEIRNLAIPGRSSLTGLEIVASYPTLPANIFIEINVMTWNVEDDFVKKFSYNPDRVSISRRQSAPSLPTSIRHRMKPLNHCALTKTFLINLPSNTTTRPTSIEERFNGAGIPRMPPSHQTSTR